MRVIKACYARFEAVDANEAMQNPKEWLQAQAVQHSLQWLLAHADDGVIWGKLENGMLLTSDASAPEVSPPLRAETLQQARLFASHTELLLWRESESGWRARLIRDVDANTESHFQEAFDEPQILWGTRAQPLSNGFTLMSDGVQGLRHAPPVKLDGAFDERRRPLRLWVRHYLTKDENGFIYIAASRLFNLTVEENDETEPHSEATQAR
jgi:CRISPR-associated protein (TIGR03984 family)